MTSMLITAPIVQLDAWKRCVESLLSDRQPAYQDAIRKGGLDRLRVWHQHAQDGSDTAVVLYEGPAPHRFLERVASANDDFSAWFRDELKRAHGIDFSQPPPPAPVLEIDQCVARASVYSCSRVHVEAPGAWRQLMDDLRPLRIEHGQVSEQILRSDEDPHEFSVLIGWQQEDRARRYYTHGGPAGWCRARGRHRRARAVVLRARLRRPITRR
jgi:hypothetical protein